ncbi:MAG: DUF1499 domain-containing protein [Xanthomonadales bacterium]|nr:DUF1499 domain-containing protein [Xanthomonadales bacterium]
MKVLLFALKVIVVLALLVVVAFAGMSAWSRFSPPELGLVDGKLRACPGTPNCVSSQTDDPGKQVRPMAYVGNREQTETALRRASMRLGLVAQTQEGDYWHLKATSQIFRFIDDVEFSFDDANQVVHLRSASRAGYSDRGVNRARAEALQAAMTAPAG